MTSNDDAIIIICRKLLKQAAWRLQYRIRMQQTKELSSLYDYQAYVSDFEADVLSDIYVKELLDKVPWDKSKYIIQRIVIEGRTEKEVALELKISQQAVNKWKKKGLETIRQYLNHSLV